jgi:hypothetical protein
MTSPLPGPRALRLALLALTVIAFASSLPLRAQDEKKTSPGAINLRFSDKADGNIDEKPLLRPNVEQPVFVFLETDGTVEGQVTVQLRAGGVPVEGASQMVPLKKGESRTRVVFAKAAKPGEKAPAEKAAPLKVNAPLAITVLDGEKKERASRALELSPPGNYVEVKAISYQRKGNQLQVRLEANKEFRGPPCRVELDLRPDRLPTLAADQKRDGNYVDVLTQTGATAILTANNLRFQGGQARGFIYLTVDGYQRAFTYKANFAADGDRDLKTDNVTDKLLRLLAPTVANPAQPLLAHVEADNVGNRPILLGFDRNNDGKFLPENGEVARFPGDRRQEWFVSPPSPEGALLIRAAVSDWEHTFEVKDVYGRRTLQLALQPGADQQFVNAAEFQVSEANRGTPVSAIEQTVTFDATGPEAIKFVDFPKSLSIGAPLPVKLAAEDPESKIKEVAFYVGKPGPDGKPPTTAELVPGKLVNGLWVAELTPSTDKPATLDVSARVTNGVNVTATETVKIQLVPAGAAPVGKASIEGIVYEGTRLETGLPQPGLVVALVDDKGVVKDSVKSNAKGVFLFTDVPPGAYRVMAAKTGSRTKGETPVQVAPGEKKENVEVKLVR